MSLLSPIFLFGLLGIALPIWLHRLQTQTTEREKFSSTMFLEPSKHRIHVQRNLKYLILMALRILFFVLLALAFTRPSFLLPSQPLIAEDSTHHVIVLDGSFSMGESNSFEQAINKAEEIIATLEEGDQGSLFLASSTVSTLSSPSFIQADLIAALRGVSNDYGRLDIGSMISSLNGMIEESQANFTLHIISDFQQTGQAQRFADMIPNVINGRPINLQLERIKTQDTANLSIASVIVLERDKINVSINGYLDTEASKTLSLSINGVVQQEINFQVPTNADQNLSFLFEEVLFEDGDNRVDVQISPSDSLPGDDLRHAVFDNSPAAPVLLVSSNPDALANTYISAALETAPRGYQVEVVSINELDTRILPRYPWIVIDDLGAVSDTQGNAIANYINGGGAVFAALGENSQNIGQVPVSGHLLSSSITLNQRNNLNIAQIDTSHPALDLAVGWNNININQNIPLTPNGDDNVLISLNNGTPLLLEQSIGQGQLILLTTSLNNSWTDLPVKPVFVTFMAEAAQYLSKENILLKEQVVDSYLQLTQIGGSSGQIVDPDGESLLSLEDTTQSQDVLLSKTGYYQVFTPQGEVLVAVNTDSRESDLTTTDIQALQNWQNSVAGNASTLPTESNQGVILEAEPEVLEIWRLLLLLLAIIVLAESFLSNRYLSFRTGTS